MSKSKTTSVGKKIKKARKEKNISLDMIANETGCAVDLLKKIESGKKIPPVGTLLQIAKALDIDSSFFLKEVDSAKESRVEAYTKRTENYAYKTLTPGAEKKHLKAFKVTIKPLSEHAGVGYMHEGEEFVYVITGKVEIKVGDHVNKLKKGDSLHFNSSIKHQLTNIGKSKAKLIVTIYSP
jgi:transcriptional regulator with XRE-family HTH domain